MKPNSKASPTPPRLASQSSRERSGDLVVGAMGLALGLVCALFPWYIFFNQDKFGIQGMTFQGGQTGRPSSDVVYQPNPVMQPISTGELPRMELDFLPTATLTGDPDQRRAVPLEEQPFPADLFEFRLVHVANGRAMIEDADGLWVVQPGSRLPDASTVSRIERRDGAWVVVTSYDRVLKMAN